MSFLVIKLHGAASGRQCDDNMESCQSTIPEKKKKEKKEAEKKRRWVLNWKQKWRGSETVGGIEVKRWPAGSNTDGWSGDLSEGKIMS